MLKKFDLFKKSPQYETIDTTLKNATVECQSIVSQKLPNLDILGYKYKADEAVEELGLDDTLINQLLEEFVAQIIEASLEFEYFLRELKKKGESIQKDDYLPFRALVHKNLGVAKNLRVKDAEILLYEMMIKEDLEYLQDCTHALKACAIMLKPESAYKALKLSELEGSL